MLLCYPKRQRSSYKKNNEINYRMEKNDLKSSSRPNCTGCFFRKKSSVRSLLPILLMISMDYFF